MAEDWFAGRVLNGVMCSQGRRWTLWIPEETLEEKFGSAELSGEDIDTWAADGGAEIFARAIARTVTLNPDAREAYVRIEDL